MSPNFFLPLNLKTKVTKSGLDARIRFMASWKHFRGFVTVSLQPHPQFVSQSSVIYSILNDVFTCTLFAEFLRYEIIILRTSKKQNSVSRTLSELCVFICPSVLWFSFTEQYYRQVDWLF
jgi:hypothetical protein